MEIPRGFICFVWGRALHFAQNRFCEDFLDPAHLMGSYGADKAAAIPIPPPMQSDARQFFDRP